MISYHLERKTEHWLLTSGSPLQRLQPFSLFIPIAPWALGQSGMYSAESGCSTLLCDRSTELSCTKGGSWVSHISITRPHPWLFEDVRFIMIQIW